MKKNNINLFIILIIIGTCSFLANAFHIRICLFYNLFKIPCPGCGLTRAFKCIFQFHFIESLRYNILAIPIFFYILFLIVIRVIEVIRKKRIIILSDKWKKVIIVISFILVIISWVININNPILYN